VGNGLDLFLFLFIGLSSGLNMLRSRFKLSPVKGVFVPSNENLSPSPGHRLPLSGASMPRGEVGWQDSAGAVCYLWSLKSLSAFLRTGLRGPIVVTGCLCPACLGLTFPPFPTPIPYNSRAHHRNQAKTLL
jgi:hypothetical protein